MFSRSSFRTELDGSAKLLGGGGGLAVACARTISTRASIAIISCVRPYPVPPPKPRLWRARSREGRSYSYGGKSTGERERDRKHDARAARLTDDPILAHISMLGRPLASRIRRARSSIARARARDSGRPSSRRIPAYVERWKRGVLGCTENFDDE